MDDALTPAILKEEQSRASYRPPEGRRCNTKDRDPGAGAVRTRTRRQQQSNIPRSPLSHQTTETPASVVPDWHVMTQSNACQRDLLRPITLSHSARSGRATSNRRRVGSGRAAEQLAGDLHVRPLSLCRRVPGNPRRFGNVTTRRAPPFEANGGISDRLRLVVSRRSHKTDDTNCRRLRSRYRSRALDTCFAPAIPFARCNARQRRAGGKRNRGERCDVLASVWWLPRCSCFRSRGVVGTSRRR
jgi:hypothetical protein